MGFSVPPPPESCRSGAIPAAGAAGGGGETAAKEKAFLFLHSWRYRAGDSGRGVVENGWRKGTDGEKTRAAVRQRRGWRGRGGEKE